jgi:transposase
MLQTPPSPRIQKFLVEIERRVPDDLDIHLIMDNYATHKTPAVRNWLARRPHWHVHFTPTGSSWLNMVERFFAEITERQIRRGVHRSERQLTRAILEYIEIRNEDRSPQDKCDRLLENLPNISQKHRRTAIEVEKSRHTDKFNDIELNKSRYAEVSYYEQYWADSNGRRNGLVLPYCRYRSKASAGVVHPRVFRGLLFRASSKSTEQPCSLICPG